MLDLCINLPSTYVQTIFQCLRGELGGATNLCANRIIAHCVLSEIDMAIV